MSEIIRVENLSYIYNLGMPDATKALDDVSFTVEEGDFVGIIGSTGSGKSTLISHFNGLNRPTSGRVLVDGKDLWEQGADLRSFRFLVGLVMQYPEYQLFEETCAKDIAYGPRNMGLDEAEIQRRVKEAAAFVGLSDELLEKSPFELSGGQKRRLQLMLILLDRPNVLILDEPGNDLDTDMLAQLETLLDSWPGTLLIVSHDRYLVERVTDDQYALIDGELIHMPRGVDGYLEEIERRRRAEPGQTSAPGTSRRADAAVPLQRELRDLKKKRTSAERKMGTVRGKLERARAELLEMDGTDYVALGEQQARITQLEGELATLEDAWLEYSEQLGE